MALTNNGTAVFLNDSYLPSGYTRPTVTKFTDWEAKYQDYVITIAKAGVEGATGAITFTALVAAITAAVNVMLDADLDIVANTVTAFVNLKSVSTNFNLTGVQYTNGVINYLCTVDIYFKTVAI